MDKVSGSLAGVFKPRHSLLVDERSSLIAQGALYGDQFIKAFLNPLLLFNIPTDEYGFSFLYFSCVTTEIKFFCVPLYL